MTLAITQPSVTEPFPPCLERQLGAVVSPSGTQFALWAPTACKVTLRLFSHGSEDEPGSRPLVSYPMFREMDGSWVLNFDDNKHGVYYDYLVEFPCGTVNRTADPWATAAGVNGRRSMVVDLARTDPDGWESDQRPTTTARDTIVWETHIGDFSNDPHGGFPVEHRGKYLAFTDSDTSVDGLGEHPTGIAYLRALGVTAVQLLPFYDYGSVDEAAGPQFNWGYDPVNYNVPEGSYSTNPFDGTVRIRECKKMIQALHKAGIKVIMDVVYNHMFSPDNWFERTVPGYYCRRKANGALANGSACGCDMATEQPMFRRFIVESVTYWAREYHIDGFRFDLMGLIDVETMNQVRASLDALDGGESIIMYGEPWRAAATAVPEGTVLADKEGLSALSNRIGHFCDGTRDAVKGHVFYVKQPGYVNGDAAGHKAQVEQAVNAWRTAPNGGEGVAGQVIQYVSAHDDLTLWDKLCVSMNPEGSVGSGIFDAVDERREPMMAAGRIAAGLVLTSAGIPFLLSGEEFARTKYGDEDSYDSGIDINQLDWLRSVRLGGLVDYYTALIALRRSDPRWFDAPRRLIDAGGNLVAFVVGEYAVFANPDAEDQQVPLAKVEAIVDAPGAAAWHSVLDSTRYDLDKDATDAAVHAAIDAEADCFVLPARSFTVWKRA